MGWALVKNKTASCLSSHTVCWRYSFWNKSGVKFYMWMKMSSNSFIEFDTVYCCPILRSKKCMVLKYCQLSVVLILFQINDKLMLIIKLKLKKFFY